MKKNYRVVKITRMNGDVRYAIQKEFKSWLTGESKWKYKGDYANDGEYTSNINFADIYMDEEYAIKKMNDIIKSDTRTVVDIQVVKEVTIG